jgi:putative ABC transport system ATP-binding protein
LQADEAWGNGLGALFRGNVADGVLVAARERENRLGGPARMRHWPRPGARERGAFGLLKRITDVKSLASAEVLAPAAGPASAPDRPVLALDDVARAYGARTVVAIASWTVSAGQHSLILGPSGSGKSTLLHLIAGLLRPSRGRVRLAGQDLWALRPAELDAFRGKTIGIVLQRLHLIRALTVRDNLRLARTLAGLPADPERIESLLADLGLAGLARARPHRLSQGEAQRVAIARAVVNQPALILADEPTSALDDANCEAVLALLRAQAEASGATLLIASHDARLIPQFRHRLELRAAS